MNFADICCVLSEIHLRRSDPIHPLSCCSFWFYLRSNMEDPLRGSESVVSSTMLYILRPLCQNEHISSPEWTSPREHHLARLFCWLNLQIGFSQNWGFTLNVCRHEPLCRSPDEFLALLRTDSADFTQHFGRPPSLWSHRLLRAAPLVDVKGNLRIFNRLPFVWFERIDLLAVHNNRFMVV